MGVKYFTIIFIVLNISLLSRVNGAIYKKGLGTSISGRHLGSTIFLDFAKSYISAYIDFKKRKPVPRTFKKKVSFAREVKFYGNLLKQTLIPKYFLIEADYYPLTSLGVYVKKNQSDIYDSVSIKTKDSKINLFDIISTRYEQPYAFSIFLGEIMPFFMVPPKKHKRRRIKSKRTKQKYSSTLKKRRKKKHKRSKKKEAPPDLSLRQSGSALMGHVFTFGMKRLIKLEQQKNYWFQYSFKIKGTNITPEAQKKWTFELGFIKHPNKLFIDAIICKIDRDWAHKNDPSLFANLKIEYLFQIPIEKINYRNKLERWTSFQKLVIGRNIHIKNMILTIEIGTKWELYRPIDQNQRLASETSYFIAPNISW